MKDEREIPDDVRRFVLTSIPSVPYLEAVLQFQRRPAARSSAEELARALYISTAAAQEILRDMCSAEILKCEGDCFWYEPDAALAHILSQVAAIYEKNLIGISSLIHDTTQRQAQHFADAFRLPRKK